MISIDFYRTAVESPLHVSYNQFTKSAVEYEKLIGLLLWGNFGVAWRKKVVRPRRVVGKSMSYSLGGGRTHDLGFIRPTL